MRFPSVLLCAKLCIAASAFVTPRVAFRGFSALPVSVGITDIKEGMTIDLDGEPYKVLGVAIIIEPDWSTVRTHIGLKNMMRGDTIKNVYPPEAEFEIATTEKIDSKFTYKKGRSFFFTNSVTLEEIKVGSKIVGDKKKWIVEGTEVRLVLFKGKVIEVVLPYPAAYVIVETEPNVEGSTGEDYTKPAVLDCGVTINVPGFLEQGQEIGVDTETGEYLGYYADETAL